MKKNKILIVNDQEVKKLITIKEACKAIENVFRFHGKEETLMPPKVYLNLEQFNGDFRAMPSYVAPLNKCGIKWVNVHPDNKKKALPTVMGIIILSDPKTGLPLCIMEATYATALRTGAAGGVAAKHLAKKDSKKVALVGCGVQARTQLLALNEYFNIETANIWGLSIGEALDFKKLIRKEIKAEINVLNTVQSCIKDVDIIVTTTPSRKPLIKKEWLKKGVHINAIGADAKGKQELDPAILKSSKVVIDSWEQACHSGEINVSVTKNELTRRDIYSTLGKIVSGQKKGRTKESEITVFDSTGLSVQDIAIADLVYKKALKKGFKKSL